MTSRLVRKQFQGLRETLALALLPPPALLVSEWARQKFRLSSDYSATTGHFEPYPYQVEPLDVLSPSHPTDTSVLMCAAQMMKTLIMLVFLGYVIDVDPGPALIVQPNKEDADSFSKERLAPMIRDVPAIAAKVVEAKSRDSGNTILQKRFRGGSVSLTGTVSPRGLRRRSVRYLLLDEVDGYQETSDGDPVPLAAARTSKFWNRKIVLCSTPTTENGRIAKAFEDSDQRFYFVPCPFCRHEQRLVWERVRWGYVEDGPDGKPNLSGRYIDPTDAHYQCRECRGFIPHHRKLEMLHAGRWIPTNPQGKYPGFQISRLYSPDWSWGRIVTDPLEGWLAAKDDAARVRTFKNNVLAETYKEPGEAPPDYEVLMGRRDMGRNDAYRLGQVPSGVRFLTSGVDIQTSGGGWMDGYVWGWGRNRQRWAIDHFRIERSPFDAGAWDELSEQLQRVYMHASGVPMSIRLMAVDSGHAGNEVYRFARQNAGNRVLAVDGRASGELISSPTLVDVTIGGRKIKNGCKLWGVNVSRCKSELYGRLQLERPKDGEPYPTGWVHFATDLEEEFFLQLVSEEFRCEVRNGVRKFRWEPIRGRRHESLDCHNYARAAACLIGWDRAEDDDWSFLEHKLGLPAETVEKPTEQPAIVSAPAPPTLPPTPVARASTRQTVTVSSFMRSFLG